MAKTRGSSYGSPLTFSGLSERLRMGQRKEKWRFERRSLGDLSPLLLLVRRRSTLQCPLELSLVVATRKVYASWSVRIASSESRLSPASN